MFLFFTASTLSSCKKNSTLSMVEKSKVEKISDNLVNSEIFATSLDSIVNNTIMIFSEVNKVGGKKLLSDYISLTKRNPSYLDLKKFYVDNNLDDEKLLSLHARNLANVLVIMQKHPELSSEDASTQADVFYNISANLRSDQDFSGTKIQKLVGKRVNLFKQNNQEISLRASGEPTTPDPNPSGPVGDMTWQTVGACALNAVGGAIAGSFKLFKQLHSVITGYNLGYSAVVNVATSAFRTFAGSNAAGMAITFGVCIAAEYLFGDNEVPIPPTDTLEWALPGDTGDLFEGGELDIN